MADQVTQLQKLAAINELNIIQLRAEIHTLPSETGLEILEFRRIVKHVQKGEREARQAKKEMVTKRLAAVLKKTHPALDLYAKRRQGEVTISWVALARLTDISPDSYRIEWNLAEANAKHIDMDAITLKLAERDKKPGADIVWG